MDFYGKMRTLETRINTLHKQWFDLFEAYKKAEDLTRNFLDCCKEVGIDTVSIQTPTDLIPRTRTFSFGCRGSVFSNTVRNGQWPALWGAVESAGLERGCGNGHDTGDQMETDCTHLIDGVYELKDGAWRRVPEKDETYGEPER